MKKTSARAFAPASIGNLGVGFDILGMAIEEPGDTVEVSMSSKKGVHIEDIIGDGGSLPRVVTQNTAGQAIQSMMDALDLSDIGLSVTIYKNLPLGSGLGSSAASAVAAVYAVNELLQLGLSKSALLPFACAGEAVASGSLHADNVAPSLLGGIVLIRDNSTYDIVKLPIPTGLYAVVVHPNIKVLTQDARNILKKEVPMPLFIQQTAHIACFVSGLFLSDFDLIKRSLSDVVIEPQRASLIPGFYDVKERALQAGALGCSISGAGPAVFALFITQDAALAGGKAMQAAFASFGIASTIYCSRVNDQGAYIL